ncbi:hypothetical protein [Streptomyces sp. T028]|uniref:hypothetical protein n=1 Tax=Streptomyces sp. T028 TaxID=3394379 RepID=UPI003A8450C0
MEDADEAVADVPQCGVVVDVAGVLLVVVAAGAGRCPPDAERLAQLLGISDQTIHVWRRRHLIDTGQLPGANSSDLSGLAAARKRIAESEAELAIHRWAAEPLGEVTSPPKALRSHPRDGP